MLWTLLLVAVALAVSPVLVVAAGRRAGWLLAVVFLAAAALFTPTALAVWSGEVPTWSMPWIPELGVDLSLRADGLGVVFTYMALLIGAVVLTYSASYLPPSNRRRSMSFYPIMVAFTVAMIGLVLTDNLLVLFVAWELTSLASFLLIGRSGAGAEAPSMRTLLLTFTGGLFLLAAVGAMWARTGTTVLSEVLTHGVWDADPLFTGVMALLVALAAMTKSAQFPFHVWLPDAMAAATPVSAYLHAAAVVKAGIFLLMRFSPAFADVPIWNALLICIGLFTSLFGGYLAVGQDDLKRLMAYSTVSQLGLIVAAVGVGTAFALGAAVVHTITHALFKSGLFMVVGVIDRATGTRDVRRLPHLARAMPAMFVVTVLGAASIAGVPPMLGFISKEGLLGAMRQAPGPIFNGWIAFAVMTISAVVTFTYTAKIVTGGYIDGDSDREIMPVSLGLRISSALPIVLGLPLALAAGLLDIPVNAATTAANAPGSPEPHVHLALWHGITPELIATAVVIGIGIVILARRTALHPHIERRRAAGDGTTAINRLYTLAGAMGRLVNRMANSDSPTRHLAFIALGLTAVIGLGAAHSHDKLPPLQDGVSQPLDALFLVLMTGAVIVVCTSNSRLGATVALSTIGIVGTTQIFSLGAPDVGLTQLLVESLTVIVIMLVLQKLPLTFGKPGKNRRPSALAIALLTGTAAGVATHLFNGRRFPSGTSRYYLGSGAQEAGGENVTNLILVEFRALDTFGELAVLGMTAVSVIAIISTVRHRHLDPPPKKDRSYVPAPKIPLQGPGTLAHRAVTQAWGNAVHMQMLVNLSTPIIGLLSLWLFWRGHNAPGGGFVAALVGSCIVAMVYLATSRDRQIGPPKLPLRLITAGIVIALVIGGVGFIKGSFLAPLHFYIGEVHLTTSLIFDVGIYLAVLGLMLVTFNLLGTSASTALQRGEQTRERADEAVEGELPGPMDTSRGERPIRYGRGTRILSTGREYRP